jgi:transposase
MKRTTIGLDLAKRVFQVHLVDANTGEMVRVALKRSQVLRFFVNREPSIVIVQEDRFSQTARSLFARSRQIRRKHR